MTPKQKAYRLYLQSDHWKALRESALVRDGEKCVRCPSNEWLQVHHLVYRTPWEYGVLEDVETVCRKCHRKEHGLSLTDLDYLSRDMDRSLHRGIKATTSMWRELKELMIEPDDNDIFGELVWKHIMFVHAMKTETERDWWMDKTKFKHWSELAFRVRKQITHRNY